MSSPNEPGHARASESGANGATPGPATGSESGPLGGSPTRSNPPQPERIADPVDVPPWQRGAAARPAKPAPRPTGTEPRRSGATTSHSTNVDARLNRFLSGGSTSTPAADQEAWADPPEPVRPEEYKSELPDLSGPRPPAPPRKPAGERPGQEPVKRPAPAAGRVQVARHQGPVRASMQIRRVDPWSVLKVSLLLSVALFFVWMIAVAFLYLVLGGMGVWSKLNSNVGDLLTSASGSSGGELVSSGTIFGGATLIGLVNIVLLTAMATVGAFIYNLSTDIVGGIEVTLADRD